jgi:hypothetical protein
MKSGIDTQQLIDLFANASAKQGEALRKAVHDATLGALQGRELTLKNIRGVLQSVSQAAGEGVAKNLTANIDPTALLDKAVAGMDDALLKAVEANRLALDRLLAQGADFHDKTLKKAVEDLEKFDDMLMGSVKKAAEAGANQMMGPWNQVLEKMQLKGTASGSQAAGAAQDLADRWQSAMRESRAASIKAAQTLAQSYAALASGVLIGLSDALQLGAQAASEDAPAPTGTTRSRSRKA